MNSSSKKSSVTKALLERMEKKIISSRPQIKVIKEKYGQMSYFDYSKQKNRANTYPKFQERKDDIVQAIKSEAARLLGSEIASQVQEQLKKNDSFSTAEHSAPLGSTPHMLNSGLHTAIPMFKNNDPRFKNVIILACSGVSFNNDLSFSRGFQFHEFKDKKVLDSQVTFFGRAVDPKAVLFAPPYNASDILELKKRLENGKGKENKEAVKINELIDTVFATPHAYSGSDYVDQLTITNYYMWKKMFPSFKADEIPNFIMLSQEKILLKMLVDNHIYKNTPISRILFKKKYHLLMEKYFDGITGAFHKESATGTFLFWGLREDGRRLQLERKGTKLVAKDKSYSVNLTPEEIEQAIRKQELIPSLLLTFIVLSFYYGMLLGGGASQTSYLTDMKNAYVKMMEEVGDTQSIMDSHEAVTDDFVFFRPHLAFIDAYGHRISASGMDMYLYENGESWDKIIQATKSITVEQFITILAPILYKQFCPDDEKEEALMNISRADVEKFTGFDKKLPPLAIIR